MIYRHNFVLGILLFFSVVVVVVVFFVDVVDTVVVDVV